MERHQPSIPLGRRWRRKVKITFEVPDWDHETGESQGRWEARIAALITYKFTTLSKERWHDRNMVEDLEEAILRALEGKPTPPSECKIGVNAEFDDGFALVEKHGLEAQGTPVNIVSVLLSEELEREILSAETLEKRGNGKREDQTPFNFYVTYE